MISISPLNKRRLNNFRSNKRGWYSFQIFTLLFFVSLFGDFIANDKPLLIKFNNEFYFPVISSYPETIFGGDFETEADYRDPYVKNLINEKGWMVWPIIPFSYNTIIRDLEVPAPAPPSKKNWLGTDDQARDVLARLIYGFRISILFGLTLTFFFNDHWSYSRINTRIFWGKYRFIFSALYGSLVCYTNFICAYNFSKCSTT